MEIIADLHVHSHYSRSASPQMDIRTIAEWAALKGIGLAGTGDFTHPLWFEELRRNLKEAGDGVYRCGGVNFILTAEVSNIYQRGGKTRKVHNLIAVPSFEVAGKVSTRLATYGKLLADGTPLLALDCEDMLKMLLDISGKCVLIPAHVWRPHFSAFGAGSAFRNLEDCFGRSEKYIYAVETGISSGPAMNWKISALDSLCLVSNSNARFPRQLGREANIFDLAARETAYDELREILRRKDRKKFLATIEYFPEEGKYHYDGHRSCGVRMHPQETDAHNHLCPKCGRKVSVGVLHRIGEFADRGDGELPENPVPFIRLMPLDEIIADALNAGKNSALVEHEYREIVRSLGTEFDILRKTGEQELLRKCRPSVVEGILNVRRGMVDVTPGFDGESGSVRIRRAGGAGSPERQLDLFSEAG